MKKLLFILLFIPFLASGQIPTPLVDLSQYHDDNRIKEMTDLNFTNITTGIYTIPLLKADSINARAIYVDSLSVDHIDMVTERALSAWEAGRLQYDTASRTVVSDMGIEDVRLQMGEEMYYLVVNRSGSTIFNGTPVYASGVDATFELFTVDSAKANNIQTALSTIGIATADIPDDSLGLVTRFGIVRDFNTSSLTPGNLYLAPTGGLTSTKPTYPNQIVILGAVQEINATTGRVHIDLFHFTRPFANKSYSFTSNGIGAGTYYVGGFYDASAADANLDEGSLTVTHGAAGNAYAAHPFMVAGAAGSVDAGQVGLRVIGASITDLGVYTAADTAILTTDITTLSTDDYLETSLKFNGTITIELYEVSGSPTTYSLDFNYGYAKYEDFGNVDFTVYKIEVVGLSGGSDTNFDMTLFKHSSTGWTYSAAAFSPGNTAITDWSDTMAPDDNLTNNEQFAWKVVDLNEFIEGDMEEGIIVRVVTGANNSVQSMDVHIIGYVESF